MNRNAMAARPMRSRARPCGRVRKCCAVRERGGSMGGASVTGRSTLKFLRDLNADHARLIKKRHRIGKIRLFSVDHARIGEVFSIERERQFGGTVYGF